MAKKELPHFKIGSSYGGNQEWFRTFMMRLGGCGAETACDCSIYFAREFGIKGIYPFDPESLTRADYVTFGHIMEKYLWPRRTGINTLDIYINGYAKYLAGNGIDCISMRGFDGSEPYERACEVLRRQIDNGYPIPNLTLYHTDRKFRDYVWHWFILNGYEDREDGLYVKAVTYSGYQWMSFERLWNTGHEVRGGLVLFEM